MSENIKFLEAVRALYVETNLSQKWSRYRNSWKQIAAQWVLESGYGGSKLAMIANNFAGLKWRKELDPAGIFKFKYSDWAGENDTYFLCSSPADFADLYFRFIERPVYDGISIEPGEIIFDLAYRGFVGRLSGYEAPDFQDKRYHIAREYRRRVEEILKSKKFNDFLTAVMCFPEIADTLDEYEKIMMPDFGFDSGEKDVVMAEMPKAEVKMSFKWSTFRDELKTEIVGAVKEVAISKLFQVFFRNKDGKIVNKSVDEDIKHHIDRLTAENRYHRALADEYKRCLFLSIDMNLENGLMPDFVLNEPVKPDWL